MLPILQLRKLRIVQLAKGTLLYKQQSSRRGGTPPSRNGPDVTWAPRPSRSSPGGLGAQAGASARRVRAGHLAPDSHLSAPGAHAHRAASGFRGQCHRSGLRAICHSFFLKKNIYFY